MPNVLVNRSVVGACYDIEDLFGTAVGQNYSLDEMKAMKCSEAMIWAKEVGIVQHPEFYLNFTDDGLMQNSSYADFQCALYTMKGGDEAGTGWNCTYPCTSTLKQCPPPTPTAVGDKDLVGEEPSSGSSFPWWGMLLIALAVIGLIALGIMYAMGMFGKKEGAQKKKKRAAMSKMAAPAAPDPAPAPPAAPAAMTAPPVYVSQSSFVAQQAPTAVPIYTAAAPVASVAAPVPMYTAVAAAPTYMPSAAAPIYTTSEAPVATFG